MLVFFFFNDTATTEIYTLSLHDALPIWVYVTKAWRGRVEGLWDLFFLHEPLTQLPSPGLPRLIYRVKGRPSRPRGPKPGDSVAGRRRSPPRRPSASRGTRRRRRATRGRGRRRPAAARPPRAGGPGGRGG